MQYAKMVALAAVAAGALMAFIGAGTASATVICSTTIETCPTAQKWGAIPLDFSIPSGSSLNLTKTNGESLDKCSVSTIKGKITNTGSSTQTVTGPIESLTWSSCTFSTVTLKTAPLEVHHIAGTSNGTVTTDGIIEVTINTVFFGSCIFKFTNGVSLGDLKEGKPGTFAVNAVADVSGGVACPETGIWSANYTVTEPQLTTLSVSPSTD